MELPLSLAFFSYSWTSKKMGGRWLHRCIPETGESLGCGGILSTLNSHMVSVISTCPYVPVNAQSNQYASAWGLLDGTSDSIASLFNAGYLGVIHASPRRCWVSADICGPHSKHGHSCEAASQQLANCQQCTSEALT